MSLPIRNKETAHIETVRIKERQLWLATGATALVFLLLFAARVLGKWDALEGFPFLFTWGARVDQLMWIAFFPLHFRLAMPLLALYRPQLNQTAVQDKQADPVRSASLTPRNPSPTLSSTAWVWPVGLWLMGFAITFFGLQSNGVPEGTSGAAHYTICGIALFVSLSIALIVPLSRQTMFLSPEPMDSGFSDELSEAYRELRVTKARWMYSCIIVMVAFTLAIPIGLSMHKTISGSTVGLLGAVVGSTIGIAGGVFGTVHSMRSLKIQRLLRKLTEGQTPAS